jgi:ParB family chromosome partitioning protein
MKQSTISTTEIPLKDISISPFNYRYGNKPVNEEDLQELSQSIKTNGVIQPILVRPLETGKYELVVGERRYRASMIAGKKSIPALVRELTDEQVKEIQVIENIQREDPHPMAEAIAIQTLLSISKAKNKVEDVAGRIGKSTAFVYQRMKLNDLTKNFREMFFSNAITISQALKLSRLDEGSQADFFNSYCKDWQDEGWSLNNFNSRIKNYQLDLSHAPFDTKDAKLDKKAGACTKCPNNIAATTSLFPEDSEDARCTNRPCYENKCRVNVKLQIMKVFMEYPHLPIAVKDESTLSIYFSADDTPIKGKSILVEDIDYKYFDEMPEKPDRENFQDYEDADENEAEYQDAFSEYNTEMKQLQDELHTGNGRLAVLISEDEFGKPVCLYQKTEHAETFTQNREKVTEYKASDYQEALKTKTVTQEILGQERQRLLNREERSKELDEIKLQEAFYNTLKESESVKSNEYPLGANDKAVSIFLLYASLSYYGRRDFENLILENETVSGDKDQQLIQFFFNADDSKVSLLTRLVILNASDVKSPNGLCGLMLRHLVEGTPGMDAGELVNVQRTVTKEREMKLSEKLNLLQKQEEKLK